MFNSEWDKLLHQLGYTCSVHPNNHFGGLLNLFKSKVPVLDDLKNTRFVHSEPYWHQCMNKLLVSSRICSHEMLPDENNNRSVKVFKYLSVFSSKQLYGDQIRKKSEQKPSSAELKLNIW